MSEVHSVRVARASNGREEDRQIFLWQADPRRKGRLTRFKEIKRPRQPGEPRPLIFVAEVIIAPSNAERELHQTMSSFQI